MRVEAVRVCDLAVGMLLGVPASRFQHDCTEHIDFIKITAIEKSQREFAFGGPVDFKDSEIMLENFGYLKLELEEIVLVAFNDPEGA